MDGVVNLESLTDLVTPWCVRVVATLRVADRLADGPLPLAALADGCDARTLGRVLRHLVSKGLFGEPEPGMFALTDAGQGLRDPALRIGLDLDGFGGRMAGAWSGLLPAVRTGRSAYAEVFGRPFWADLEAHPAIGASFDDLMGPEGHGAPDPEVVSDWAGVSHVVDVGGGTGALLAEILWAHPEVRGTLVDLPRVVERAAGRFAEAGLSDRVTLTGGSFFDKLPTGGDLYVLKSVLADWPDPEAATILRRCAEAARPTGARVLVVGGVSARPVGEGDLLMLVLLGGEERELGRFRVLAEESGLTVSGTGHQPSGRFVVECRPV